MKTTGTLLARLRELVGEAGKNYFERITIASELLSDVDWLATVYKNDAIHAAEMLEEEYFHDLCGAISIWELIHIVQKYPEESAWKAQKYNLRRLYESCKPKVEHKSARTGMKKADFVNLQEKFAETEYLLKQTRKELIEARRYIKELEESITEYGRENEELNERLDKLEKVYA